MSGNSYSVMVGPPGPNFSWGTVQGLFALTAGRHEVQFVNSGNGFDDFCAVWCQALNASEAGTISHFAMIHLDIAPAIEPGKTTWLDTLIEELDAHDLDMVSAIVPLKDFRGLTSSGIGDPSNPWSPMKRFTIREVAEFPETFDASDAGFAGYPLLHNTGCWACDLRREVFHQTDADGTSKSYFAFPERVYRDASGKWVHARESEDWFFSRQLHALGAKTAITRKVKLTHTGSAAFQNHGQWGTYINGDEDTAAKWRKP